MENVKKFIENRIEDNRKIFSEEEYRFALNNNIIKKVYILGALDAYKTIKDAY